MGFINQQINITGGGTKNVLGVYLSVGTGRILAELPYNRDAATLLQYIYKWALKKLLGVKEVYLHYIPRLYTSFT